MNRTIKFTKYRKIYKLLNLRRTRNKINKEIRKQ